MERPQPTFASRRRLHQHLGWFHRTVWNKSLARLETFTNTSSQAEVSIRAGKRTILPRCTPLPASAGVDPSKSVNRITCHKRMVEIFSSVFGQVQTSRLQAGIFSFGGCFAFRQQRTGTRLSTHSWGIAIDLNTGTNRQGSAGNMDAGLVEVFRAAGFEWGGEWSGKVAIRCIFSFVRDIEDVGEMMLCRYRSG